MREGRKLMVGRPLAFCGFREMIGDKMIEKIIDFDDIKTFPNDVEKIIEKYINEQSDWLIDKSMKSVSSNMDVQIILEKDQIIRDIALFEEIFSILCEYHIMGYHFSRVLHKEYVRQLESEPRASLILSHPVLTRK